MEPQNEEILRAMIGKNADFYLEKFNQLERGEKTKFQWSAFLLGPYLLLYRKCYGLFKKYFVVPYILMLVGQIIAELGVLFMLGSIELMLVLMVVASVISVVGCVWVAVSGVKLGKNFSKLYLEHLNALKETKQIQDVEHSRETIRYFATADIRGPVAFLAVIFIVVFLVTSLPMILFDKAIDVASSGITDSTVLEAEADPADTDIPQEDTGSKKATVQRTGGLLDLSAEELYSQMLGKYWMNEETGDLLYIETSGISATDGSLYDNNEYIGDYSVYGVYGSESPYEAVTEGTFQLEVWLEDNLSALFEVSAADAEHINLYNTVNGEDYQYILYDSASQELTQEEAKSYLIQCMSERYPEFDAAEDFGYLLQSEDEESYHFQVVVKNAKTTSNNMGFYCVYKSSGEIYDDVMSELIWTP